MSRVCLILALLLLLSPSAWAADGSITTPDANKKIDTDTRDTGAGTVHRQRVQLPDVTGTTVALNASNAAASVEVAGNRGVILTIAAGTLEATAVVEVSQDNQTTWVQASFGDPFTGLVTATLDMTNPNSALTRAILFPGPITHARVRISSYVFGTASATLRSTVSNPATVVYGADLAGSGPRPLPFMDSTPVGTEMAPLVRCIGCTSTGGTSASDNTSFTYGTTAITPLGAVFDSTPGTATDGRVGFVRRNANGDLHTVPQDPSGAAITETATNAERVTLVTVASTQFYNRRAATTFSAAGSLAIDSTGIGSIFFEIDSGTLSGTIIFEGTTDDSNWFPLTAILLSTGTANPTTAKIVTSLTSFGSIQRGWIRETGFKQVRLRVSAFTSGSAAARMELSAVPSGIDPTRIPCSQTAIVNSAAATTPVQLVAGVTGQHVYVCGIDISADGTTTADIVEGTSSSCASAAAISATHRLTAQVGWVREAQNQPIYKTSATGRFVCLRTGSNIQTDVTIRYEQF